MPLKGDVFRETINMLLTVAECSTDSMHTDLNIHDTGLKAMQYFMRANHS